MTFKQSKKQFILVSILVKDSRLLIFKVDIYEAVVRRSYQGRMNHCFLHFQIDVFNTIQFPADLLLRNFD